MKLVCPAGNLPMLKAAISAGADAVYIGFRDDTNARHFAGLNFADHSAADAIDFAHAQGREVYVAINTYPQPGGWQRWQRAVDAAADLGVDALILADLAVLDYAASAHPALRRHLSVQGSATNREALRFYREAFGIERAVLPRVLSLAQVRALCEDSPVQLEVFGFGSLCVMVEGRCHLSSFLTGESPNTCGACSPASKVRWEETAASVDVRLNEVLIDRFEQGEMAGYPVVCKGRYRVGDSIEHALEEPTSLNTLPILPQLRAAGVAAVKIEGRQRSVAYVKKVVGVWRAAIDQCSDGSGTFTPSAQQMRTLAAVSEGAQTTLGPYDRPWQ
jgi:collagenase-like PrtC family protease